VIVAVVLVVGGGLFILLGGGDEDYIYSGNGDIATIPEAVVESSVQEPLTDGIVEDTEYEPEAYEYSEHEIELEEDAEYEPDVTEEPEPEPVVPEEPYIGADWQELLLETMQAAIAHTLRGGGASSGFPRSPEGFSPEFPRLLEGFILADLNFDGIPELLIVGDSVSAGSMVRIFTIRLGDARLIFAGEFSESFIPPHTALQRYRRISDGSPAYLMHGGNSGDVHGWGSFFLTNAATPMDGSFSGQSQIAEYTWEFQLYIDTPGTAIAHYSLYTLNGREVSEDEFYRFFYERLNDYEIIPYEPTSLGLWVWNWDWSSVSENDLRRFIESFDPDGAPTVADSGSVGVDSGTAIAGSGFILPYSSIRPLTEADLHGLTADELMFARNEIFARHGRRFRYERLQAHFDAQDWYTPTLPLGVEPVLSALEIANIAIIQRFENR